MTATTTLSKEATLAVDDILTYIGEYGHTTFVEIERIIERHGIDHKGTMSLCLPEYPEIILWAGMSDEAADILDAVMTSQGVTRHPTSQLCYLIDGGLLRFPIAKRLHHYKDPHWLPITLSLGKIDSHPAA